jgi:catechol 2,3-dioxygenase-like lactoylglutathione lyase family enzyme
MFSDLTPIATLPAKNLAKARTFYEGTLGLKAEAEEGPGGVFYRCGDGQLFLYESSFAGTNKATAVTWTVGDDIGKIVKALEDKGVPFEHYEWPGVAMDGHIHVMGDMKVAWFKDPEGNILNLINR